jgi:hypothetical protein
MAFNQTTLIGVTLGRWQIAVRKYFAGGAPGVPVGWYWQFSLRWPKGDGWLERCWYGKEHTPPPKEEKEYVEASNFYRELYSPKVICPLHKDLAG